jgi:hypothetical protein
MSTIRLIPQESTVVDAGHVDVLYGVGYVDSFTPVESEVDVNTPPRKYEDETSIHRATDPYKKAFIIFTCVMVIGLALGFLTYLDYHTKP